MPSSCGWQDNSTRQLIDKSDQLGWHCRYEAARLDDGSIVNRPVIRLPDDEVLTRIKPTDRDTSMIMRIRPGWEALRRYLSAEVVPATLHAPRYAGQQNHNILFSLKCMLLEPPFPVQKVHIMSVHRPSRHVQSCFTPLCVSAGARALSKTAFCATFTAQH